MCHTVVALRDTQEHLALALAAENNVLEGLKLTSEANTICGGTRIWSLLTGGMTDSDAVKNIQWPVIEAEKQKHLDTEGARLQQCETELEGLTRRLTAMLQKVLPSTTKDQIEPMIQSGLSVFGEHGALAFKCGASRRFKTPNNERVRLQSTDPYADSVAAFEAAAKAFFETKAARFDGDVFEATCHAMLEVQPNTMDADSYCKPLCQAFRSAAQRISNEMVGADAVGVDELKDQIRVKEECARSAKESLGACASDWKGLEVFRSELTELSAAIDGRFADVRSAMRALDDARDQLDDLEGDLEEQERALEEAIALLADAGGEAEDAKAALAGARDRETGLKEEIAKATSELERLTAELKDAERASNMVAKLKTTVEAVMELMDGFAEAALREPVRNVGFDDFPEDMMFADPVATQAGGDTKTSIVAVRDYCDSTALPAFAALKKSSKVDLGPLCEFEEPEAVFEDLTFWVKQRQQLVKADMEKVLALLTPYKFKQLLSKQEFDAAEEEDANLVSKGQAAGLEKVMSAYTGKSSFYKYLVNWRLNGPFRSLIRRLQVLSDQLTEAVEAAKKNLATLQASLLATQKELQDATVKLAEATKKVDAAVENKAQLEEEVESLKKQSDTMATNIEELEKALAQAYAALEKAKASLVTSHAEGTSKALLEVEDEGAQVHPRLQFEAQ